MLEMPKLIRAWKSVRMGSIFVVYATFQLTWTCADREEELDQVPEINEVMQRRKKSFVRADMYIRRVFLCTTMRNEYADSLSSLTFFSVCDSFGYPCCADKKS